MDILDDAYGTQTQKVVGLEDLIDAKPLISNVPASATRNRVATMSMLTSQPQDMVEKYRTMLKEDEEGNTTTYDQARTQLTRNTKDVSLKHIMGLLGDPSIPMSQKKSIMNVAQKEQFKEEPAVELQMRALSAPSQGESVVGEAARIKLSDTMGELQKDREMRQKLANSLDLPDLSFGQMYSQVGQAEVMPFGRNVIMSKVAANIAAQEGKSSVFGRIKDFLLPGSAKGNIQDKLASIPPEKRADFANTILKAVKESASVFPSDNHYAQYKLAEELLNAPAGSTSERWTENVMTLLDTFWVKDMVKGANTLAKNATAEIKSRIPQKADWELVDDRVSKGIPPSGSGATPPQQPTKAIEDKIIHKADWQVVDEPFNPFAPRIDSGVKRIEGGGAPQIKQDAAQPTNWELMDEYAKNPLAPRIDSGIKRIEGENRPVRISGEAIPEVSPELVRKRLELNSVVRKENPATPYSIIEQVNPEQARAIHKAIVEGTDEVAEAMTGVNREQAIINNVFPQMAVEDLSVLNKANQEIHADITQTGATRYTSAELEGAVSSIQKDFRDASYMAVNDAMTTFRVDGDHIVVDAVYAPLGGSFTTQEAAIAQAKFSLRNFGIKDSEITVLEREGMSYVPARAGNGAGDYQVRVSTRQPIKDTDVQSWSPLEVHKNALDRISFTGAENYGSATSMIFDPASMFDPVISGSASIAADQSIVLENYLLQPIRDLREMIQGMASSEIKQLNAYFVEANTKGLPFDTLDLAARQFTPGQVQAVREWRNIWDGHYYLENFDMVRTLNSQGYKMLDSGGTTLFAKEIPKNKNIVRLYDPQTNSLKIMTSQDMDALYNLGGTYATLRRPINVGGVDMEHMIVRNNPSEYLRTIRDTDTILNYREGYYTVHYGKGSRFIDEHYVDSTGKKGIRTVGVAGNTLDATRFKIDQELRTGNKHVVREDSRGFKKDGDGYWDLNEASGRIAQRVRGKPLQSPVGMNQIGTAVHTENPMESAVRAAKGLSGRTVARPMLETAKRRFVEQYGDLLEDKHGVKVFPNNRSEIVDHVSHTSSRVADARSTYQYIRFLENGYINSVDQIFKGGMNVLSDMLGKLSLSKRGGKVFSKAEEASRAIGDISPTHALKGTVFHAYIGLSLPIRQWIVQSHQAGRLVAYNPVGFINGGMLRTITTYLSDIGQLPHPNPVKGFREFVENSGMLAGVDQNSLVRGLGLDMADRSSSVLRMVGTVASAPQRYGFDIGEKFNQLVHLANVHEKWTREGKDLANLTIRDMAYTEARAIGLDMNRAGELSYTNSSAAAILQFLQLPQKALLQATSRKLAWDVKARLFTWDMLMYGSGLSAIGAAISAVLPDGTQVVPKDPMVRDMYEQGIMGGLINELLTQMDDSGERTQLDLAYLDAYDMAGWARMYSAGSDKGMWALIASSPAGQLLAVNGVNGSQKDGRIPTAMITLGRFFNLIPEIGHNPTTFPNVINDVAKISSGWTSADKARVLLSLRKTRDSMGNTVDSSVTAPEAWAAFIGIGTMSSKSLYEVSQHISEDKKKHEEKVMAKYRDILTYYSNSLESEHADVKYIQEVSHHLMKSFADPYDMELVNKQWAKDMVGKDQQLFKKMYDASGMPGISRLINDIAKSPIPEEQKAAMIQRARDFQALRKSQQPIKE